VRNTAFPCDVSKLLRLFFVMTPPTRGKIKGVRWLVLVKLQIIGHCICLILIGLNWLPKIIPRFSKIHLSLLEESSWVSAGDVLSGLWAGDVQTDLGWLTHNLEHWYWPLRSAEPKLAKNKDLTRQLNQREMELAANLSRSSHLPHFIRHDFIE